MTALERLAMTNYGHFTTMLVEDGRVRGLGLHLERLANDCATLFATQLCTDLVRQRIRAEVAGSRSPVTVRVTVTDPDLPLPRPSRAASPQVLVTTRPATTQPLPPLAVRSVPYTRDVPTVKHTGLFGPLYERRRAQLDGYDDVVFTGADDVVNEGATWNIGFIDGDTLIWPTGDALPGITARLLAGAYDGPQRTEPIRLSQLPDMAAAFATNAASGLRPLAGVDATTFATDHPVLRRLRGQYRAIEPDTI
ncbi:aminotransferase class IV [Couchioplanes azureus]|uniref:aminotransferase class IV n=1 Tax=Couchioplanes caeruleus TaxID=56438 RepID=UPI001670B59A|nr:aminotransferase class IV [Couchioplanes caeruleus]